MPLGKLKNCFLTCVIVSTLFLKEGGGIQSANSGGIFDGNFREQYFGGKKIVATLKLFGAWWLFFLLWTLRRWFISSISARICSGVCPSDTLFIPRITWLTKKLD